MTIWFKHAEVIIRFMHLSKFVAKLGKVKEGEVIALTGNTGSATTGDHLHIDISKKTVQISNFLNFLDPEKYKWETQILLASQPETPKVDNTPIPPETGLQSQNLNAPSKPVELISIPVKTLDQIAAEAPKENWQDAFLWVVQIFKRFFNLLK